MTVSGSITLPVYRGEGWSTCCSIVVGNILCLWDRGREEKRRGIRYYWMISWNSPRGSEAYLAGRTRKKRWRTPSISSEPRRNCLLAYSTGILNQRNTVRREIDIIVRIDKSQTSWKLVKVSLILGVKRMKVILEMGCWSRSNVTSMLYYAWAIALFIMRDSFNNKTMSL